MNKEEEEKKYICPYCNKEVISGYMLREHISYGHKGIMDFERSNIYKSILRRLKSLEDTNENLLIRIKNLENNLPQK